MSKQRQERVISEAFQTTLIAPDLPQAELIIRAATLEDIEAMATLLVEAFPSLYNATFGKMKSRNTVRLLTVLYHRGVLSVEDIRVCTRGEHLVGVAILHTGTSIGRGSLRGYWRALRTRLGLFAALRAFFGGVSTNAFLNRRIPHADDLVYIEALAVRESERGQGVGTLLLSDAEAWAREHGRNRIALHVLYTNRRARRLYERVGFRPWRERQGASVPAPPRNSGWAAQLMLRQLSPTSEANSDPLSLPLPVHSSAQETPPS